MKALVIIRPCPRDDRLAYRCYNSFKEVGIGDKFIFFAEKGEYPLLSACDGEFMFRAHMSNFGGRDNVRPYIEYLKKIDIAGFDKIVISDADIIVHKNFLDGEYSLGGIQQAGNPRHFSGQLLIFDNYTFDWVINYPDFELLMEGFIEKDYCIADDTVLTWVATLATDRTRDFNGEDYWTHTKEI